MEKIIIDFGVYTALTVDLTEFDFTGVKEVVMTASNWLVDCKSSVIFERKYTEPIIHNEIITPDESKKITNNAYYDFDKIMTDGKRYKLSEKGKIEVRRGCGECQAR